jgi:hypothetical protein
MKHESTTMNLPANVKALCGKMSSLRTKKFESLPSAGEVILTLFWDTDGPMLEHYQDHGMMVYSAWCCTVLDEEFCYLW